jgi:hypothetical protein
VNAGLRTVVWSFVVAVLGGAVAAGASLFLLPVREGLVLDVFLLYLGAVTLLALVRATSVAQPGSNRSPYDAALRPPRRGSERPRELLRLEQRVALAETTAFDSHYRLRPVVRSVCAQRLWARHGVDLDDDPERAERLLGPDVWELARPDRPPPREPFAAGPGVAGIERVIGQLERV